MDNLGTLKSVLQNINKRITRNPNNKARIVLISRDSGVWLYEDFLRDWNTVKATEEEKVLTTEEQFQVVQHNNWAYRQCSEQALEGNLSINTIIAMENLLKSEDRRILAEKVGLCYDWEGIINLVKSGRESNVEQICTRDFFLIKTLAFWCEANNSYTKQSGQNLPPKYTSHMKNIYKDIMEAHRWKELKFPNLSISKEEYTGTIDKEDVLEGIDKDFQKINKVLDKANKKEFIKER